MNNLWIRETDGTIISISLKHMWSYNSVSRRIRKITTGLTYSVKPETLERLGYKPLEQDHPAYKALAPCLI